MITLAWDCLLFTLATGETVPFSADMICVELSGEDARLFDPDFVKEATGAVFHYFKHELGRESITVGEFSEALEKVLQGFDFSRRTAVSKAAPRVIESDLRRLVDESGSGCELFFFHRLRDELRLQLERGPQLVRFSGLRSCVKQLAGARRWSARCRTLHEQIVDYLRNCLSRESAPRNCALLVK
jgi:hypothetical protein